MTDEFTQEEIFDVDGFDTEDCQEGDVFESDKPMAAYTEFTIRKSKPTSIDKNYKCYVRKVDTNGWNGCIQGKPVDKECNVLANCVGYAQGRFCEIYNEITGYSGTNKYFYLNCDAWYFPNRAADMYPDLKTGSEPKPGAIMCWAKTDAAGHVAIVERVNEDGSVLTSESGYNGDAFFSKTRSNKNGNWGQLSPYSFECFIYNPAVIEIPVTDPVERNERIDQILCSSDILRVRTKPSLNADVLGFAKKDCYYNNLGIQQQEGYTWYKIDENQWFAQVGDLAILNRVYDISVNDLGDTSDFQISTSTATAGAKVNFSVYPLDCYRLDEIKINNGDVSFVVDESGNYVFTMPESDVNIYISIKEMPQPEPKKTFLQKLVDVLKAIIKFFSRNIDK